MRWSVPQPQDPRVVRDANLRRWHTAFPDAVAIADVVPRQPATCVGVVRAIRLVPGRALEVVIEDGTGQLTGVWPGRTNLPGVDLGTGLRLTGTVADHTEDRRMLNPGWVPVADPTR